MKIVIIHLGNLTEVIPATSILKTVKNKNIDMKVTWVVSSPEIFPVFSFNNVKVIDFETFKEQENTYDLLINLYPYFPEHLCKNIVVKEAIGFNYNNDFDKFKPVFSPEEYIDVFSSMNIFQLYYLLAGLKWRGEGYDLHYYPKTKSSKNKIGISIANANLRNYILDELKVDNTKLWYIPYKKNIYKKMDEINRCEKIVTDDILTFHLSMILRKYVYFLQTFPLKLKLEMFKNGEIHNVSLTNII